MRVFGHPLHVMLLHFPVALWPAHEALHLFASHLPAGAAATAGYWLLVAGTALGWFAAFAGLLDLAALWRDEPGSAPLRSGLIHAAVNGTVLIGFTVITLLEYRVFPAISHGPGFLLGEAALIVALFVGNYFGGAIIWHDSPQRGAPKGG